MGRDFAVTDKNGRVWVFAYTREEGNSYAFSTEGTNGVMFVSGDTLQSATDWLASARPHQSAPGVNDWVNWHTSRR